MKRKIKLTVETERVLTMHGGRSELRGKCEACGAFVRLVNVDEAAMLARVGSRAIYRLVEAGKIHFIETREELLLICLNSLCGRLSRVDAENMQLSRFLEYEDHSDD